ncbi:hypothetical protein ACVWWO_001916 [Bradyrhizobium sp. F1.13.1]
MAPPPPPLLLLCDLKRALTIGFVLPIALAACRCSGVETSSTLWNWVRSAKQGTGRLTAYFLRSAEALRLA